MGCSPYSFVLFCDALRSGWARIPSDPPFSLFICKIQFLDQVFLFSCTELRLNGVFFYLIGFIAGIAKQLTFE
jgi:hypothetical protein